MHRRRAPLPRRPGDVALPRRLLVPLGRLPRAPAALAHADRCFQRAATATINPQQSPYRVSWHHFERSVERAADAIPSFLRRALEEVTLVLRNHAAPEVIDPENEGETCSIHLGPTRDQVDQTSSMSLPEPAIHLYRRPHEHLSSSAKEFDARVLVSLVHGLGTFMGYNEDRIGTLVHDIMAEQ